MIKLFVAAALAFSVPSVLFAQQRSGTEQERRACAADVERHCRKIQDQGDLVVLDCLKQNRAKISPSCNKVLVDNGQ